MILSTLQVNELWNVSRNCRAAEVCITLAPAVERPELQPALHDQRLSVTDKSYVIDLLCCSPHTDTAQSDYVSQCQVSRMCAVLLSITLSIRVSDKFPMTENVNNHTYGGRWNLVVRGLLITWSQLDVTRQPVLAGPQLRAIVKRHTLKPQFIGSRSQYDIEYQSNKHAKKSLNTFSVKHLK